ncbi:hypothetical protein [Klebsiella pneumoniae]|uniref:hypothetical protein n=1 Tax=Klebsiella pneumoniae TaxID=573 RepID=UPI000E2022F0|nr:hypothetical protein [Klebsiella pneumoniae]
MKERGMIFNSEMVRAILDGRKTQTRRIMKVQPSEDFTPMNMALETDYKARWYTPGIVDMDGYLQPASKEVFGVSNENEGYSCPFGAVGDRIWVRETWNKYGGLLTYRADHDWIDDMRKETVCTAKWVPSIHMPRWASRILLEITDVRVERLRSMSQDDARAEGVIAASGPMEAGLAFRELWDSIYGEESWNANPWVWVIEFKRVEGGAA